MKNNYVLSNLTNLSKFTFYLLLAITLSFNVNCGKKKNKAMFWMAALTGEGSTTGGSGSGGGVTIQTDSNGVPLPGELTGNTNVTGNTSDSGNTSNTTPTSDSNVSNNGNGTTGTSTGTSDGAICINIII